MKENFVICIESMHIGDTGSQDNVSFMRCERCCVCVVYVLFGFFVYALLGCVGGIVLKESL